MRRWLVAGGAALAALVVLEAALRLGNYATPDLHQLDAQLGWSLRAHKQGWYAGDEGRTRVVVNPAGFRDRERVLDKSDPVYRIAVLGDEYSEAMPVALRDTWWWQLEPKLQHCDFRPGKLVEVLNFSVAGYGTAQELILLQSGVMRYAPDLVKACCAGLLRGKRIRIRPDQGDEITSHQDPGVRDLFTRDRLVIVEEPFLIVEGVLQNLEGVTSVRAEAVYGMRGIDIDFDAHDFY